MAITFCGQQLHGYGLGQPISSFHSVLLGDAGGGEFLWAAAVGAGFVVGCVGAIAGSGRIVHRADTLHADAHFVADADDALRFFVGVFVELGVVIAADEDAHFVVVDLAELVQVEAGDDGVFFVQVALGVQVLAKAGAYIALRFEPFNFLRLQLAFAVDDAHINLQAVLVFQQLSNAVVELEKRADEYQSVFGAFDQLFEKVIGCGGVEKLCHAASNALKDLSYKAV